MLQVVHVRDMYCSHGACGINKHWDIKKEKLIDNYKRVFTPGVGVKGIVTEMGCTGHYILVANISVRCQRL